MSGGRLIEHISRFLLAVAAAALAATAYLYFEFRRGATLPFSAEMGLAALLGLVVPLSAVALYQRITGRRGPGAYLVFVLFALLVVLGFGAAAG